MGLTNKSLLLRARGGQREAWELMVAVYRPFIRDCLLRQHVGRQEADDLTQDVLAVVVKEMASFEHSGRPGSFRRWLRTITLNRARLYWRKHRDHAQSPGGSSFQRLIKELEDPASAVCVRWEREHDDHVLCRLLEELEAEFDPHTIEAFRLLLAGKKAGAVAAELGMTAAAVYAAKSRVLRRLRSEAEGLIGEGPA